MKTKTVIHTYELELAGDLHARPSADVVEVASRYAAKVEIRKHGDPRSINAKSIIGVIGLGARKGDGLTVRTYGARDAREAVVAVKDALLEVPALI